ncbi:Triose-phosphate transporter domain [Macleaya cordata]|uniref:Triose-phosphate transporter domain n=1 Tax=Macleaya cordata TaxID=56857 RepID=A0A200QRE9_MACCD|nr:Triose-phosphate transporter domain [Macleaya cordata]
MLNFLIRKDVRKILKRKDSDAGERGRALEDLRASLFNELRTSDGAKRQQQRICGPTVALSFNFLVSVGIILVNKLVLGKVGFNYPIFLTFIHYILSWFLMAILKTLSLLPASPPSKSTPFSSLLSLGIVMSLSNGLANVSLKYNSVGFYQMAKIAVTPTIVLAEFVFFRKRVSYQKVIALTVVSIGVAVATVTDLQFHFFGACIALAWIIPSAVNKILWSNLQQQENWTALALMWKTTPITLLFLVTLMPWLDPPGILSFDWNRSNTSAILVSAVLGFLLQWSGALALGATSATTHVVLGQFKTCVILLGGFLIFGSNPGTTSICGAVTALAGMSVYTYLNLLNSQHQPNKTSPRQAPFSLTKSKLSKENGETHDGKCTGEYV